MLGWQRKNLHVESQNIVYDSPFIFNKVIIFCNKPKYNIYYKKENAPAVTDAYL